MMHESKVNILAKPHPYIFLVFYCNSLDTGILSRSVQFDFAILEKSFPSHIKSPRSRDISLSLGTLMGADLGFKHAV